MLGDLPLRGDKQLLNARAGGGSGTRRGAPGRVGTLALALALAGTGARAGRCLVSVSAVEPGIGARGGVGTLAWTLAAVEAWRGTGPPRGPAAAWPRPAGTGRSGPRPFWAPPFWTPPFWAPPFWTLPLRVPPSGPSLSGLPPFLPPPGPGADGWRMAKPARGGDPDRVGRSGPCGGMLIPSR